MNGPSAPTETSPRAALAVASVALATDALLYGLAVPVLPQLARETGASTSAVGVLFAAYAAALVVATPLAGRWLDRRGTRPPMLAGLVALAGATVLFALARSPELLLVARALQGAAAGVTWTASLALIASTTRRQSEAGRWASPCRPSGSAPSPDRRSAACSRTRSARPLPFFWPLR